MVLSQAVIYRPVNRPGQVLFASLIGTTIEFFDFYIYATAAVIVFPRLFFPTSDPASATLASLATLALAQPIKLAGRPEKRQFPTASRMRLASVSSFNNCCALFRSSPERKAASDFSSFSSDVKRLSRLCERICVQSSGSPAAMRVGVAPTARRHWQIFDPT